MVAHRCGFYFRHLYQCMSESPEKSAEDRCSEQFVNWVACIRDLSGCLGLHFLFFLFLKFKGKQFLLLMTISVIRKTMLLGFFFAKKSFCY